MDDYCTCGHTGADHVDGTGRCRRRDDHGDKCACNAFEYEPEHDIDED